MDQQFDSAQDKLDWLVGFLKAQGERPLTPSLQSDSDVEVLVVCTGLVRLALSQAEGINTLVTRANHIRDLKAIYQNQLDKAFSAIKSLPYPDHNKKLYLRKLSLGISRCMVCLDQLENLEKRNRNVFSAADFSRRELVCDMEKPGNLLRSLHHHLGTPF